MKRVVAANKEWFQTLENHSIQLLYGLTRHLDNSSPHDAYARLLAKFVENDCEKCDRMVELCLKYDIKMRQAEYRYYKSDEAEEAKENGVDVDLAALNAKLEGGGDLFHRISVVIAFAAQGSKRCHEYILDQLRTQNSGIGGTCLFLFLCLFLLYVYSTCPSTHVSHMLYIFNAIKLSKQQSRSLSVSLMKGSTGNN